MAQRITLKRIAQWIAEGRGSGHGTSFQPWIKIQTRGSPSLGNLQFRYIPELGRYGHLLSAGELRIFIFLLYLGVADLRDQFPCWPWEHPHPLYLHPDFNPCPIPWSAGTLSIAKKMGISHPRYPGTRIFHIPTIDVLATVPGSPNFRAVAFAIKPDPDEQKLSEWDAAKLAITSAYCEELSFPWHLISAGTIPETLSENLKILVHYSGQKPQLDALLAKFSELLTPSLLDGTPISSCIRNGAQALGLSEDLSFELFHRGLWFKTLPVDPREPWIFGEPAHLCNGKWIDTARNYLLGA